MDACLQWIEPKSTAVGRAKFRNELRVSPLALILGGALIFATVLTVASRIASSAWHLPSSIAIGLIIGGLLGAYNASIGRFPSVQQEIDLRSDGFTIRGTKKCSLRYDELRGYSIIYPTVDGVRHKLLSFYPRDGAGAFSIGIPATVSDDAIRALIADQIPFETIIDERALTIT
jgi:hypothetical protein